MSFEPYIATNRLAYGTAVDFHITDAVAEDWYGREDQEMIERWWCKKNLKPGSVVADCGAHHGMMTVLLAKWTGETGRVISYEVVPENAVIVEKNAELNQLRNVRVRHVGVGETSSTVRFNRQAGNAVVGSGFDEEEVPVTSLDEEFGQVGRLDFLKMDVEGWELAALRGAQHLLERERPLIDLELHPFLYRDRNEELKAIFDIIDTRWTLSVSENQGVIIDLPHQSALTILEAMMNPHIFCVPR